jgi:UDP-N-acetylglucosamine--N-acetylmuramyl-(pentapeptide) pyrophosphoryl-undecaprenol N-acetylglucosamine transferase
MEARIVAAAGLKFATIKAGKFRRLPSAGTLQKLLNVQTLGPNTRDAVRTVAGVADSLRILRKFKPDVIFLKGGFVCIPVGLAARMLHIPYVIHESDVSPGLANRVLGKWAARIAVGFPAKSYRDFDKTRLVYTGNPVRQEVLKAHRLEGIRLLKLEQDLPVVLVTGGSQGAAAINDAVVAALPLLLPHCQIIHLTGEHELDRIKFELSRKDKPVHVERYHPYAFLMAEMAPALAAADVVIARAGANTVAELAALGKPTVLIPNYLMAGHQVENARVLSRGGAVRVLEEPKMTPERLAGEVNRLLQSEEERAFLGKALHGFAKLDADRELAQVILEIGRDNQAHHGGVGGSHNISGEEETL